MLRDLLAIESHAAVIDRGPRVLLPLTGVLIAASSTYGAVLGMWRGDLQILFASIKLPLVLLITCVITIVFLQMTSLLMGLRHPIAETAILTILAMTIASVVLASISPAIWLFTLASPTPSVEARTAHNLLFVLHTFAVAAAGCVGTWILRAALRRLAGSRDKARRVLIVWIATLALVGGEVSWALRPFVGSVYLPTTFLRADALDGNVYEFLITDIAPHLMGKEPGGNRE